MLAPAAATVAVGSSFAEWSRPEGDEGELCAPWMYDANGAAVMLPADAIGLRARYWPEGARGIGEMVEDDEGQPVFIPRNATIEEFRRLVGYRPGRYKLIALDRSFQFLDRVPLVSTAIKPATAARAGFVTGAAAAMPAPSGDAATLAQVLSFLERTNAQAFAHVASAAHELAESHRATLAQLGGVVGPVAGVLSAAGAAGVVKKTLALDAATAGAPVTVQMMPANANDAAAATVPRNAASATTTATAATAAATAEKGAGMGDALMALGLPIVEKLGTVLAYGAAKKLDVPDDYARSVAGVVQSTAQIAAKMMQPDAPPASPATPDASDGPASTVGVAARVGRELMAHVFEIQRALSEDDRAWVMQQMAARPALLEAFKPAVAEITVGDGVRAVAALRAMDGALTTVNERAWFDRILTPQMLPTVFRNLFITAPIESAIECVRERAALGLPID